MREILFRGKRLDNGDWAEGSLLKVTINRKTAYLIFGDNFSFDGNDVKALSHALVDPATVGQYTGLQDKNGKRIFEGDVFEWGYAGVKDFRYVVSYDADIASFFGNRHFSFVTLNGIDIEIIGNIHDNPELIGGAE